MQKKYDDIKDTYCYYAMQGFSTHPHGQARPCCINRMPTSHYMPSVEIEKYPHYSNSKFKRIDTIDELINDPAIMDLRKLMLNGKKAKSCDRCWNLEDAGIKSFRQIQNEIYEKNIDKNLTNLDETGYLNSQALTYLDISLGNICNLKCRSCNPWNSHRWLEEGPHLPHTEWNDAAWAVGRISSENPWYIKAFKTNFFDSVLPNIKTINFLGGEPLVVKEHYSWLEHIIANGWAQDIELFYNTNGTTIPKKMLDIWSHFKGINLSLSLDARGDLAYYVRYPSEWKIIEKNIEKLKNYSKDKENFRIQTHMTLSVLNIHDIDKMLDWCHEQYKSWHYYNNKTWKHYGYQNSIPHFNIVEYPGFMHVRHLPDEIKVKVNALLDSEYLKYKNIDTIPEWEKNSIENIKNLKNIVNQDRDPKLWNHFVENTKASDKFRGINIVDYIPWMADYI